MSLNNLKSLNRKKYKRAVNKLVRAFNKDVQEDWLWNGRFELSQMWTAFKPFEDNSGALYVTSFVLTDKNTGYKEYNRFDNFDMEWRLWHWANYCITDVWKVWSENPNPNERARLEGRKPPER